MPNWVSTKVVFTGNDEDIKTVLGIIANPDAEGETEFDFNKLIPMPKELDIVFDTNHTLAYLYYYIRNFKEFPSSHQYMLGTVYKSPQDIIDKVDKDISYTSQEMLDLGKKLYQNKQIYGATNWYDWCVEHWGTKWNAHDVIIENNTMYFYTAWAFAEPIMQKLAEICNKHNVEFEGMWADEDVGNNTGNFCTIEGGHLSAEYFDYNSSDALSAYVECWGELDCIGVDEQGEYYKYECDKCPHKKDCV